MACTTNCGIRETIWCFLMAVTQREKKPTKYEEIRGAADLAETPPGWQ
jgi:hypothetical protein